MDNDMETTMVEEAQIKDILYNKIAGLKSYSESGAEAISYRLAEILVLSKDLFTKLFPEMMEAEAGNEKEIWDGIMGIRMHLLHLKDCIEDFDSSLIEFMEDENKEKIELMDNVPDEDNLN